MNVKNCIVFYIKRITKTELRPFIGDFPLPLTLTKVNEGYFFVFGSVFLLFICNEKLYNGKLTVTVEGGAKMHVEPQHELNTYEDIEREMGDLVEKHIAQGRFLQALENGEFTPNQIREFALQYSYYSRNFPRVIGTAIGAVKPEDDWWVPLVDNLWDEAGRGNPKGYHSRLYHSFLVTAAPDVATDEKYVPDYPVCSTVIDAVEVFVQFLKNATPLEAMAAVGFGSEFFAGQAMGWIGEGLKHPNYNASNTLDVTFWLAHADRHEPRHYQLCKNVLERYQSKEDLLHIYRAGAYIALSEANMYEGLYHRMQAFQ